MKTQIDIRQSVIWERYLSLLGWQIEKVDGANVFIKKLPFGLSVAKIQRSEFPTSIEKIDESIEKFRPLFIKIEPNSNPISSSKKLGIMFDRWTLLPTKTIRINLEKSLGEIFNSFEKDTRYAIRKSQKDGVNIKESKDLDTFIELLVQNAKRKKIAVAKREIRALFKSAPENSFLLFAQKLDKPLAAALFLWYENTGYYMYAASTLEGNKFSAPSLLIWTGIQKLKRVGCTSLDLEGITDVRYKDTKSWQGFTNFKNGFGGEVIEYPGSFVKFYNPLIKFLFRLPFF